MFYHLKSERAEAKHNGLSRLWAGYLVLLKSGLRESQATRCRNAVQAIQAAGDKEGNKG